MTQQPPEPPQLDDLLNELTTTPDNNLEQGVIKSENATGSLVEPVYSKREMRCYSVTESELQQLSLVNTLVAFAWSVLSGIGLFFIDVAKDVILAEDVPVFAVRLGVTLFPLLVFFFLVALFGVIKASKWRKRLIDLIKEESGGLSPEEPKSESWKLQWPLTRSKKI